MFGYNREEKKAEKELKNLIHQEMQKEKEIVTEETEDNFTDMGARQRLNVLMHHNKADNNEKKEKKSVDVGKKENTVFLEAPLPSTLAVDLIPIDWIKNGTIHTEDNRYIKIVEVMPINFLLKSNEEQESIIFDFEKYLKVAPAKLQFKVMSKKTDISRYIQAIDEDIMTEESPECRRLLEDGKKLITGLGTSQSVSRRFFIIFEYRKVKGKIISEEEIEATMTNTKIQTMKYVKQCGNGVIEMKNNTDETARILFDILNRHLNSSTDFEPRVSSVYAYYDMQYGKNATQMIPITEYFTPKEIDLRFRDYMRLDETYYTYLYITSEGYPLEVPKGWTSLLVSAGEGIDVDIFMDRMNKEQYLNRIGRRLRWQHTKLSDLNQSTNDYDVVTNTMESGFYLKNGIGGVGGGQDIYYVSILITLTASSRKALMKKRDDMATYLKTYEIYTGTCDYEMKRAFTSYLPICSIDKKIFKRAKRNVLTKDLAAFYPFTSYEMNDEEGILLGVNELSNSLCIADLFNTKNYRNANLAIMGVSGAGKSYLLQLIATRFRKKKIQTFVIAPDKGYEFKRCCDYIGGQFIDLSPASEQCINIMEIRQRDTSTADILDGTDLRVSELAIKIENLHVFFSLLVPDLTNEEDQMVDEALMKTYAEKGITQDNDSLYDPERPGEYKTMPVLGDVYRHLKTIPEAGRVARILSRLVDGSAKSFNQQTNVDLDNLYTIINITNLKGPLLVVGIFIALDYVYSKVKEDRTMQKVIIMDELWELIRVNPKAAEYVLEIFKIIRGYGGAAVCATQDLTDFFALEDGKYGKSILNACNTKIVLKLEKKEAMEVKELLDLSYEEYKQVLRFNSGHGLLSTNGNNVPVRFCSSEIENALITTNSKELRNLIDSGFFEEIGFHGDVTGQRMTNA